MATKRTGHTGGKRPPGGWPSQRVYEALRLAAVAEAKAKGKPLADIVEEHFPGALRPAPRRNGKAPALDC
jgi:hypothetical protein